MITEALLSITPITLGGIWYYFRRNIPKRKALRKRNLHRGSLGLKPVK